MGLRTRRYSLSRFFVTVFIVLIDVFFGWHIALSFEPMVGPEPDYKLSCPDIPTKKRPETTVTASRLSGDSKRLSSVTVYSLNIKIRMVDANPLFFPGNEDAWQSSTSDYPALTGPASIHNLGVMELKELKNERIGVAADGESQLLLILKTRAKGIFEIKKELKNSEEGRLQFFREGKTCDTGQGHVAYALYTAPPDFGKGSAQQSPSELIGAAEVRSVDLEIIFRPESGRGTIKKEQEIKIVRPPVVLVHGLFDEPVNAWMTGANSPVGPSLNYTLQATGFETFLVDYQLTNGTGGGYSSSFDDNRYVVWNDGMRLLSLNGGAGSNSTNTTLVNSVSGETAKRGGIRQALSYYRDNLRVAATQADVIGHSMGGILARVNASYGGINAYNKDYKRADNFWAGDINRLITIDTPHFGSGQIDVFEQLVTKEIQNESWAASFYRSVAYLSTWVMAISEKSKALQDLKLQSPALKRIGKTEIPSHVIAAVAREGGLREGHYDPDGRYMKLLQVIGSLFYFFP